MKNICWGWFNFIIILKCHEKMNKSVKIRIAWEIVVVTALREIMLNSKFPIVAIIGNVWAWLTTRHNWCIPETNYASWLKHPHIKSLTLQESICSGYSNPFLFRIVTCLKILKFKSQTKVLNATPMNLFFVTGMHRFYQSFMVPVEPTTLIQSH